MNAFKLAFAAAALAAASLAQAASITGSGTPATQQREAAGFTGIGLALPGRVEIVQGAAEGVSVTADDNLLAEIETVVERGVLQIRWRSRNMDVRTRSDIRVTVNARTVESIAVAGSGDVSAPALASKQLAVRISGSGDVKLAGRAESLEARISGSGDIKASRLETERAKVHIAGSGDATVWARKALEAHVAGSGTVRYYGDPSVSRHIAGSGSVRKSGDTPG